MAGVLLFFILTLLTPAYAKKIPACSSLLAEKEFCRVDLSKVRPTQFCNGKRVVSEKIKEIKLQKDLEAYLIDKKTPIIIGPQETFYLLDHHHLSYALKELNQKETIGIIKKNWSRLSQEEFEERLLKKNWAYLLRKGDGPLAFEDLPKTLDELIDDLYRSLADFLQEKEGAIDKTNVLYAEFMWADYLRDKVDVGTTDEDFKAALKIAAKLAKQSGAAHLPGYKKK